MSVLKTVRHQRRQREREKRREEKRRGEKRREREGREGEGKTLAHPYEQVSLLGSG